MAGRLFFSGIPTKLDVEKLMALELGKGDKLTHEKAAELLGVPSDSNRFKTIIGAYRKRLFREKLLQTGVWGGALHVLTDDQAHDAGISNLTRIGRFAGRARVRIETVASELLTGERRDKHNLLRREAQAMHEAAQKSVREIAAPKPITTDRLIASDL